MAAGWGGGLNIPAAGMPELLVACAESVSNLRAVGDASNIPNRCGFLRYQHRRQGDCRQALRLKAVVDTLPPTPILGLPAANVFIPHIRAKLRQAAGMSPPGCGFAVISALGMHETMTDGVPERQSIPAPG